MTQILRMEATVEFLTSTCDYASMPLTCIRSSSFVHRTRPNLLQIEDEATQRRHSMPSPFRLSLSFNDIRPTENDESLRRVRSFKTTSKGVVNNGDILSKRGSGSIVWSGCTVTNDNSDIAFVPGILPQKRKRTPSTTSQDSGAGHSYASSGAPTYFRVLVLGSSGVGRTVLTNQFMSSENTGVVDDTFVQDHTVSVVLDGEESFMEFCSYPTEQLPEEDINVDAYLIVYSITDRHSYENALEQVKHLRNVIGTDRTVIVVANKTDLVRNRVVSRDEARLVASYYECKYIETSASLNHNVDELLVGLLSQIRMKLSPEKLVQHITRAETRRLKDRKGSLKTAKSILKRLFERQKSLSCDNLYEL